MAMGEFLQGVQDHVSTSAFLQYDATASLHNFYPKIWLYDAEQPVKKIKNKVVLNI